jgi:hypothetical protein
LLFAVMDGLTFVIETDERAPGGAHVEVTDGVGARHSLRWCPPTT